MITDYLASAANSPKKTPLKKTATQKTPRKEEKQEPKPVTKVDVAPAQNRDASPVKIHPDELFKSFRKICADIASVSNYTDKTEVVRKLFTKGMDGSKYTLSQPDD